MSTIKVQPEKQTLKVEPEKREMKQKVDPGMNYIKSYFNNSDDKPIITLNTVFKTFGNKT